MKNLYDRVSNLKVPNNKIRTIQVGITDNSANTSIIEGFNIDYEPLKERER